MKSSCIYHPANNESLNIHLWQLIACEQDTCAAGLLSILESILTHDRFAKDFKEKYQTQSDLLVSELGIPLKLSVLKQELMSFWSEKKISESLSLLNQLGFIRLSNSSNPFERTKYIRFHPEECNAWIRLNYSENGEYIGTQNNIVDARLMAARKEEMAVSRKTKGRSIENTQNSVFTDLSSTASSFENKNLNADSLNSIMSQPIERLENAKPPPRECSTSTSVTPKSFLNINQTKSININQANSSVEELSQENKGKGAEDVHPIIKALLDIGLAKEKFNYPDVIPSILDLEANGANPSMYLKAFEKAMSVSGNRGFGVKYLNRVVEDILRSEKKDAGRPKKNTKLETKSKNISTEYETDLSNALQWTSLFTP